MNPSFSAPLLFLGAPGLIGNHVIPAFVETGIPVLAGSRRGQSVGAASGAVAALKDDQLLNRTFDLSGPEALHTSEVAEQIGSAIGRPIRYQVISAAAMEAGLRDVGMDPWFAAGLAELYAWVRDSGLASEVTDTTEQLLGRKPTCH